MSLQQVSVRGLNRAVPVNGDQGGSLFANAGPDTVYYGGTRDVTSADGTSIAASASATLVGTQYLVVAGTLGTLAKVTVTPTYPGTEGDATVLTSLRVTGNEAVGGTLGVTGASTLTGALTTTGGIAGGRPRLNVTDAANSLTYGTDSTPVSGTVYVGELWVPANATITGVSYLIGSVGGTDKAIVALYSSAGAVLANSALAGTTVGTTATYQQIAFTAPYAAVGPKQYFVSVSMNGTTARLRTIPAGGVVPATSATGVFGTLATITAPTTFTADTGPVAHSF